MSLTDTGLKSPFGPFQSADIRSDAGRRGEALRLTILDLGVQATDLRWPNADAGGFTDLAQEIPLGFAGEWK